MNFRIDLDTFRGPMDLLLYLVRKHEVEIVDLRIAEITEQFLAYLEVLQQLDIDAVGDFLQMASTLVEIKSRMVLPHAGEEPEEIEDPRQDLVRRLLEYKKYRDAANLLEERSRAWREQLPRLANDLPPRERNLAEEPIHEVELWDLVSAFGRILRERQAVQPPNIVYDDTPIHVYMEQIHERLRREGRLSFRELFKPGMHKSSLIGLFLAVLELVRHHWARADQTDLFGELLILPGRRTSEAFNLDASSDSYEHGDAGTNDGFPEADSASTKDEQAPSHPEGEAPAEP